MTTPTPYTYHVTDAVGRPMMGTIHESCRYPRETERRMMEAGYKIYVNGKRLTGKDLKDK